MPGYNYFVSNATPPLSTLRLYSLCSSRTRPAPVTADRVQQQAVLPGHRWEHRYGALRVRWHERAHPCERHQSRLWWIVSCKHRTRTPRASDPHEQSLLTPRWPHEQLEYAAIFDGKLFFSADDGTDHGEELWSFDGTDYTLYDLEPATSLSNRHGSPVRSSLACPRARLRPLPVTKLDPASQRHLTVFNGKLYFQAYDQFKGRELWSYDGTNPPSREQDISSPSQGSSPVMRLTHTQMHRPFQHKRRTMSHMPRWCGTE